MDRSVDSIGSCSLDVDADSTDFSDTSGSLNLATPSSAKDITREFTSRIKERCQISQINCQQTTTILDPTSGKITTIITSTPDTPDTSPVKKPSYLNLACCVNGYSNLTTYDSKLRQNINKSREVSPIRPSTNSLQYCKGFGNFLAPLTPPPPLPIVPMPVSNKTTSTSAAVTTITPPPTSSSHYNYKETTMTDNKTYNLQEKTVITTTTTKTNQTQQSYERNNVDVTDNVNGTTHFRSTTKYYNTALISPPSSELSTGATTTNTTTNTEQKSFIQQRVERLYGPGALAQGFYSPKKTRSINNENNYAILSERLKNAQNQYSNITATTNNYLNNKNQNLNKEYVAAIDNHNFNNLHNYNKPTTTTTTINTHINIINNKQNNTTTTTDITEDYENIKNCEDLPVLRHLRPEFRAQLPILSPKRTLSQYQNQNQLITENKIINNLIDDNNILTTKSNTVLTNGTSNGITSLKTITKNIPTQNITIKNNVSITNNSQHLNGNVKLLIHQQKQQQQDQKEQQQQQYNKDLQKQQQLYQQQKQQNNNDNYRTTNLDITKNFDVINSSSSSLLPVSKNFSSSASLLSSSTSSDPSSVIIVKNSNNSSDTVINSILAKTTITNDNNDMKISLKSKEDNNSKIITTSGIQSIIDFKEDNLIKSDNMASATELIASTAGTVTTATESSKIALKSIISDKDSIENLTKVINNNNIRDGHYFLQLLKTEQNRLLDLAAKAEKEIEILSSNSDISDEIFGYLRSASGKARLLVSQKMKQFEGLCNNNLNQSKDEKFPTTVEDLQGFWDMVMLQVDNVDSLFKEIEILKHNGWKKPLQEGPSPPTGSKLTRRPIPKTATNVNSTSAATTKTITNGACSKKSAAATLAAQKREAQRKQLMELKRKNKQQQQQQDQQKNSNSVEIFVSDNNHHFSS